MLLVKGFIGPDSFGGKGLFAGEDIPKGTQVWTYDPSVTRFVSIEQYFSLTGEDLSQVKRYSVPMAALQERPPVIGLLVSEDLSRHANHSDSPNTAPISGLFDSSIDPALQPEFALRDIRKGEEITCNYLQWDPLNIVHSLGVISGKSFLVQQPPIAFVTQDNQRRTAHSYATS